MVDQREELELEDYIRALEKMEARPRDRLGILADAANTIIGGAAGASLAGSLASSMGAATLLGSSTLGGLLGGIFVTSTPVGWVAGGVAAGGLAGLAISKLANNGGKAEKSRSYNIRALQKKIRTLRAKDAHGQEAGDEQWKKLIDNIIVLVRDKHLSQRESVILLLGVAKGQIDIEFAVDRTDKMVRSLPKNSQFDG